MDKAILVERDIEDGRRLLKALDEAKSGAVPFRIRAAFWLYTTEWLEWRLVIATSLVDERGPRSAYTDVQAILRSIQPPIGLSLQNLAVVSPSDPLVKMFKGAMRVAANSGGVRFTRNMVGGSFIEDAYIYRLP